MKNNLNLDQQKEIKIRRYILEKEKLGKLRFLLIKKDKLIDCSRKRVLKIINESGVITMLEKMEVYKGVKMDISQESPTNQK